MPVRRLSTHTPHPLRLQSTIDAERASKAAHKAFLKMLGMLKRHEVEILLKASGLVSKNYKLGSYGIGIIGVNNAWRSLVDS